MKGQEDSVGRGSQPRKAHKELWQEPAAPPLGQVTAANPAPPATDTGALLLALCSWATGVELGKTTRGLWCFLCHPLQVLMLVLLFPPWIHC